MKKISIFAFLLLICVLMACIEDHGGGVKTKEISVNDVTLITITLDSVSHEFVAHQSSPSNYGMAHWPECKYCKLKPIKHDTGNIKNHAAKQLASNNHKRF